MFGPTNEIQARLYRLLSEYRLSQDLDVLYAFGLGMCLHEDTEQALLASPAITGVSTGWEEGGSRYLEIYHDGSLSKSALEFRLRTLGFQVLDVL